MAGRKGILGITARDIREGGMNVDAAVRKAADVFTLGKSDQIAAGVAAGLHSRSMGQLAKNYAARLTAEQARSRYDTQSRSDAQDAGAAAATVLLAARLGIMGANWTDGLSNEAKGNIGEAFSLAKSLLKGDIPVKIQVRVPLSEGYTVADHSTIRGVPVEAKMGYSTDPTGPQRRARKELGSGYRYDVWRPHHVGTISGSGGAAYGSYGTRRSDRRK